MYCKDHVKKWKSARFKLQNDGFNRVQVLNTKLMTKAMKDQDETHITYLHATKGYKRMSKVRIEKQIAIEAGQRGEGSYIIKGVKKK